VRAELGLRDAHLIERLLDADVSLFEVLPFFDEASELDLRLELGSPRLVLGDLTPVRYGTCHFLHRSLHTLIPEEANCQELVGQVLRQPESA